MTPQEGERMTTQDWEKRFNEFCENRDNWDDSAGLCVSEVESFIRQELTTLHKADCERFREMIPKENNGESCTEVCEKRRKAGYSCYHATQDEVTNAIRTALSKMEEEKSMNDTEILTKAIKKAFPDGATGKVDALIMTLYEFKQDEFQTYALQRAIIFEHDFAKAFWGKEKLPMPGGYEMYEYEYHLQQMVLEQEPIKYLAKYL